MWAAKEVLNENPRSFLRGSLSCCEPSHAGTAGSRSIGIVLAEAVVFFLPAWAPTLPIGRQVLAWALFLFISVFALTNSLRMASVTAADQATARADRQTEGVRTADHALDVARAKRDEACGRGLGKTVACKVWQAEVAKLEASRTQVTAKVVAQARPESSDFAELAAWVSGALSNRVPMTSRCCGCCSGHSCRRLAGSC